MTRAKAKAKAKAIWKPGKSGPAASRLGIQKPRRRSFTIGISPEIRNPLPGEPIRPTAEGLDHRFLRSLPRAIGPGSLRKARLRRSDSQHNTQLEPLKIRPHCHIGNRCLQMHPAER